LHERRFKLQTSFNRVETGSVRKISLSFRFVAATRKKSFHISAMSHNVAVKLCNLYQFVEACNGIASCKIFCLSAMFHHFAMNCICWMVFLHELTQILVWSNSLASSIETFLSSRHYSHGSTFSHSVVCKRRNLVKAFKFSK